VLVGDHSPNFTFKRTIHGEHRLKSVKNCHPDAEVNPHHILSALYANCGRRIEQSHPRSIRNLLQWLSITGEGTPTQADGPATSWSLAKNQTAYSRMLFQVDFIFTAIM